MGMFQRRFAWSFILLAAGSQIFCAQTESAFPHLAFTQAVFLTYTPDSTDRIVVIQQNGMALIFPNDSATTYADTLLSITPALSSTVGEEGFLGIAFDPGFASNGYFYVNYTAPSPLRTVVKRFTVPPTTPNHADPTSGFTIIEINQPFTNHNGGMLAFGPDSCLYIGMGDGGSGGDPLNNAQNRTQLLGKILRIDVRDTTPTTHYTIPSNNPYVGNANGYREEIWAFGLRNPWRFSFDAATGKLWAGDVGQDTYEEVDIIERGMNYGWRMMEGMHCFNPSSGCDTTGLTLPVVEYDHSLGDAIVGGYVYRGDRRPDLRGMYLYGDYESGRVWLLRYDAGMVMADSVFLNFNTLLSSFGVDKHQELYVLKYSNSPSDAIAIFKPLSSVSVGNGRENLVPWNSSLAQNYPNPFNPLTTITYTVGRFRDWELGASHVTLAVYDLLGREVATLVDERKPPGTYQITFDASHLASGVYVYRLSSPSFVQSRTLLLIK
jgi:glucose/arabinose dehydrogenase